MADENRSRLGRGLAALIGEAGGELEETGKGRNQQRVPIERIRPNPANPRKSFRDDSLDELAQSVREKGILQPIVVRQLASAGGMYEIVAGERRWRAAQRAEVHSIPVVVIEASDKEALEFAIIENVQRSDLNAVEEAEGYSRLMKEFAYTQADLGRVIGKSRSHVANTLRLMNLSNRVKGFVADGSLSAGHARALLTAKDPDSLANKIIGEGLSVRDAERLVQEETDETPPEPHSSRSLKVEKAPDTVALEKRLQEATGLSVEIIDKGERGEVRFRYKSIEQLDGLCQHLLPEGESRPG